MHFTAMNEQDYSITQMGMAIFDQDFTSLMSGTNIDLASMPIPPGEYELRVNSTMAGIEIYLPHYVRYTINGTTIWSSKDIHSGAKYWRNLTRKFRRQLTLPDSPPEFALTDFNPQQPVIIHLKLNTAMSGVTIYQF